MNSNNTHQLSLFGVEFGSSPISPTRRHQITELVAKRQERRLVGADFERLSPLKSQIETAVNKWKGVTKFKYPSDKYEAMNARNELRFLNSAEQRMRNLDYDIAELEMKLGLTEQDH